MIKKNYRTKVYYTINNIPQYNEFDDFLPDNLYQLLVENKEYKFCRDDGPTVEYSFGDKIWKSSKCKIYFWNNWDDWHNQLFDWAVNTNHLICLNCDEFCKQECFL